MARVVHFEIPARDPERSVAFYKKALGWKIKRWGKEQYWMVSTGDAKTPGIDGGIMPKKDLKTTVNTVDVTSVDKAVAKVVAAGGKLVRPKNAIPTMGWLAYCADPDGNVFGLMQMDAKAK
jgi:uncharacterized protein